MAFGDLCGFSFFRYDFGATKGSGVNIVQEMTGGAVFQQSLDCLAKFGRLVVYGFAGREPVSLDPERLLPANHTIRGFYLGDYFSKNPELINITLEELAGYVSSGHLQVHMGGAFPLSKAIEAHRLLEGRQTKGKLVILPWKDI